MKQIVVGNYYMGDESVQLVLRDGSGGEVYLTPEKANKIARMKIGADYNNWWRVVSVLLHEAMELAFIKVNCRYDSNNNLAKTHDSYLFVANHSDFTEICARAAELTATCLPDLATAWKKFKKNGGKPNGKK